MAMLPFLTDRTTEESFNEMYLCCCEVKQSSRNFVALARKAIKKRWNDIYTENRCLYRRRGNIQLDHNIRGTTMLMAERIDLSDWDEWDR